MSVYSFDDEKSTPDPVYKNRPGNDVPIVIDNGTFKCRAGYAHNDEPHMVFKSVICRQKGKPDIVGNDIPNVELVRWQLRTPFDRDIVTQYDFEEEILDHIFERLSITSSNVTHPIVMTETICNPNYCRQQMNELLFECYNVPSVSYGIDALYSFFHEKSLEEDALVVSIGYNCCHVIPILDGKMLLNSVRRINVGGAHVDYVMLRLLQLAHPPLATSMSLSRAEYLVRKHASFVETYNDEVLKWNDAEFYEENVAKYQLPFTAHAQSAINVEEARKKKELQAERLRQMNIKRRRAKLEEDVQKLNKLIAIQELDEEDEELFLRSLHDLGLASRAELGHEINKLNNSINSVRSKLEEVENGVKPSPTVSQSTKKNLIPEDEVENYVKDLKKQKSELIERRDKRRQHRIESAKRRTHASQQRMRILSELAAGQGKKADTFGQRDDDWDVYKEINKDTGHSDSEEEQTKLDEIDGLLREYDPDYSRSNSPTQTDVAEYYRIHVATQQIRSTEVLFQPAAILGVDQSGISDTISYILRKLLAKEQMERVAKCIYVTGGCASIPGLKERLQVDIRRELPCGTEFNVYISNEPSLSSFKGACKWGRSEDFASSKIDSKMYEEFGHDYLKEHKKSNVYNQLHKVKTEEDQNQNGS